MVRENFKWGTAGKGVAGVDYGDTASWGEQDWQKYESSQGGGSAPAPVAPPPAPVSPYESGPKTTGQAITGNATVGQAPQQGQTSTVTGAFQSALLNRLAPGQVSAQSAAIAPAIQANRLGEQRGFERNRQMLAERAAATGENMGGGFETSLMGLAQDRAQREGQFAGDAVRGESARQAQEQTAAMGLAGSLLSDQDRLALQRYGIDTDAALRREGLGAQTSLGGRELDIRDKLGSAGLNLSLLGLLQGGDQFGQSLASQNAQFSAGLNQQALLSMLGLR